MPKVTRLLIWNILDARQVAEIKERRLRIRYAIVSAVLTADYLPARESLLSPVVDESSAASDSQEGRDIIGYFESFRASKPGTRCQRVTLVWTPKEIRLDPALVENVKQQIEKRDNEQAEGEVDFQVLHHGSSQDLEEYANSPNQYLKGKISFVRATMADKKFDQYRSIVADDQLIATLFSELSLRIPALNTELPNEKDRPRIVVVTELDTTYSRAIKEQIENKFEKFAKLEFRSYLRGLDGRSENISSSGDSPRGENQETSADSSTKDGGYAESSFGTSQLDYLRREALLLGLQTNSRKGHAVAAVGILGSDIYDKILALEAFKPQLPAAIFFTTDLDALYIERSYQDYTRYLVVAAADDLPVNSRLPPMRDSYQTILVKKVQDLISGSKSRTVAAPHIFEIARGKNIDLKAESDQSAHTGVRDSVLRLLARTWFNPVVFCLALINAFIILTAVFTRKPKVHKPGMVSAPMKRWAQVFVYAQLIVALGVMLTLVIFLAWRKDVLLLGEPLTLGISIWPSILIRLLAFVVAILFLLIASYAFVSKGIGLKEKLKEALPAWKLHLPQGLAKESARLWESLLRERPVYLPLQSFESQLDRFFGTPEKPFWGNYRLVRIIGISVGYFAISAFLFWQWQPSVPGRGAFALLDEKIVLALGVTLYMIHLIFCLDLHIGAFNFLRALRTVYAPDIFEKIRRHQEHLDTRLILDATSESTAIIGKTLLYPLTVLILIILSRLRYFDNWVMTPSLTITFALGALALVTASLVLWLEGSRLKMAVLERHGEKAEFDIQALAQLPDEQGGAKTKETIEKETKELEAKLEKEKKKLDEITDGVFAPWYNQPIFAAIFSAAAVFGSLSVAGPIARLFLE